MAVPISKATLSPLGVVVDALSHTHYLTSSLVAQVKRFAHDNASIPSMSVIMKIRTTESGGANGDFHLARALVLLWADSPSAKLLAPWRYWLRLSMTLRL
jgi:hypothetical protein